MEVEVVENEQRWRATGFYGKPENKNKHISWDLLKSLGRDSNLAWIVFGDFNQIMGQEEKQGGNPVTYSQVQGFRDAVQINELLDLGFVGHSFTWTNGQSGEDNIQERLDRALATIEWQQTFPKTIVQHLSRYKSDHSPILIDMMGEKRQRRKIPHRFRFEECWLSNEECERTVEEAWKGEQGPIQGRIAYCGKELDRWGDMLFGDIPKKIRKLQNKLQHLNTIKQEEGVILLIKEVEADLDEALKEEKTWWAQRSRTNWLRHGDQNSRFFHQKASQRKNRNWVKAIRDEAGVTHEEEEKIEEVMVEYYDNIFRSEGVEEARQAANIVKNRIDAEKREFLDQPFTVEEVTQALKQMHPTKAPGPDGMPALFYQKMWRIVGNDISDYVLNILNHEADPSPINSTHICMIPKIKTPRYAKDFRPISLCNVIFKLVTKTIANRLKQILPDIVGEFQSAFVQDRLITDNGLVAFEIFHYMKKKVTGQKGYIGIKLDMAKAYDRIEWCFLKEVMILMGFSQRWVNLIQRCVSTVTFSILVNGIPSKPFLLTRGLRQGDPLSPYLFILCAEVLSRLLIKAQNSEIIRGIRVARQAPQINHLFFADDSILFSRASDQDIQGIKEVLIQY
ncbi:hypothetical protein AHAS_Ahas06G0076000 [Arachis hypogaea]